jgi:RNA polymerase sigma factor (sigma-70 family)
MAATGPAEALQRARTGDADAFRQLTEPHRRELHVHCYSILGSIQDADDLVQETLLAAWRGIEAFEGQASVRSWLYRIATNRCLNALRDPQSPAKGGARDGRAARAHTPD